MIRHGSKEISKFFNQMFYQIVKKPKETPLGRWRIDKENQFLKAEYANRDSCGDNLCGDPIKFKYVKKD
tara:strand:+ start:377 stop:583 length:207 start_codon:yes stop_codon:yes gene_type:complete